MSDGSAGGPVFVVQRHDATSLHFDLRLEVDGVLVSWAVPRGPSLDPGEKRLAVRTGDHGLEHATFEGRTGRSRRGISTTIVWDTGVLTNLTQRAGRALPLAAAVRAGHLKVRLDGHRLRGAFALTRTGPPGPEGPDAPDGPVAGGQWLLVKVADAEGVRRGPPLTDLVDSVLTGRTNADLVDDP